MGNIRDSAEGRGPSDEPKLGMATGMPGIKPDVLLLSIHTYTHTHLRGIGVLTWSGDVVVCWGCGEAEVTCTHRWDAELVHAHRAEVHVIHAK